MEQKQERVGNLPALDALRILAAWMVLGVHVGQQAGLDSITYVGANGVQLFFILSGYLAMRSLSTTMPTLGLKQGARQYWAKRLRRILPLYWLVLAMRYCYDLVFYLAGGMSLGAVFHGPCGVRFLRYVFFLQMWLPSDDWALWNNRNALWTMSSFAFFYLLAPLIYWLLSRSKRSCAAGFCLLLAVLTGKGVLGRAIEGALAQLPAGRVENISQFSAQNPPMELYCFLLGAVAWFACREKKAFFYGAFCLLLTAAVGFSRFAWEGCLTALLLLAVETGQSQRAPKTDRQIRADRWRKELGNSSFFLYLVHPMLLGNMPFLPQTAGPVRWGYFAGLMLFCLVICTAVYLVAVRRFEQYFIQRKPLH